MKPFEVIKTLTDMQHAANSLTVQSAGLSSSIGKFMELLGGDSDIVGVAKYGDRVKNQMLSVIEAFEGLMKASSRLAGGTDE